MGSSPPTWAVEARQRLEACARAELAKHVASGAPLYEVVEADVEIIGADPRDADDPRWDAIMRADGLERMTPEQEAELLRLRLVAPLRIRVGQKLHRGGSVAVVEVEDGNDPEVKVSVILDWITARMAGRAGEPRR